MPAPDERTVESMVAEMRRKLAWAIGSTLGIPYFAERTPAKGYATRAAIAICEAYVGQAADSSTWGNPWDLLPG